jgi:hypothetical protein
MIVAGDKFVRADDRTGRQVEHHADRRATERDPFCRHVTIDKSRRVLPSTFWRTERRGALSRFDGNEISALVVDLDLRELDLS